MKIKLGIVGYGNLGKGVETAVKTADDIELKYIFTRRDPNALEINSDATVIALSDIANYKDDIDVLILCSGSATDLPEQTPKLAKLFNVVDSFDTHAKIPDHFKAVDLAAKSNNKVGIISVGWDPGMFSLQRLLSEAILPNGESYTFWGKGVSQGHSDAIRRIDGVIDARQYTIPIESAVEKIKKGLHPTLSVREKHKRECFVVVKEGADLKRIEQEIKTMPNYFDEYDTTVHFISMEELIKNHSGIPHGGLVIRSGSTNNGENEHIIEYKLKLDSNPEFTSSILIAYARAAKKLYDSKQYGCKTVFDIPISYLTTKSRDELLKTLL